MAFPSRGWSLQKSAICSNVNAVFSTSQTAVAFGIKGWAVMINSPVLWPPAGGAFAIEDDVDSCYIGARPSMGARLEAIDLGGPMCPMGPEGAEGPCGLGLLLRSVVQLGKSGSPSSTIS